MDEKKLEQIKEKIHTINPEITDELLDLLHEYIFSKYYNNISLLCLKIFFLAE